MREEVINCDICGSRIREGEGYSVDLTVCRDEPDTEEDGDLAVDDVCRRCLVRIRDAFTALPSPACPKAPL